MNKQPTCIAVNSTHADRNLGNLRTLRKVHLLTLLVIASATTLLLLAGCSTPKPGSAQALAVEKEATEKKDR